MDRNGIRPVAPDVEAPGGGQDPEAMNGSPVELGDAVDDPSRQPPIAARERLTLAVDLARMIGPECWGSASVAVPVLLSTSPQGPPPAPQEDERV
jgi:hypothetical protein